MKIYFRIEDITAAAAEETLANYLGQQDTSGAWAGGDGACWWSESTPIFSPEQAEAPVKSGGAMGNPRCEVSEVRAHEFPYHLSHSEGSETYRNVRILHNGQWTKIAEKVRTRSVLTLGLNLEGMGPGVYLYEDGQITLTEFDRLYKTPNS